MQTFLKDHISHIGTFLYILVCHILLYQWMWNCKLGMYVLLDYDLNMLEIGKYTPILKNNTRHLSTNNIISYFRCSYTKPHHPIMTPSLFICCKGISTQSWLLSPLFYTTLLNTLKVSATPCSHIKVTKAIVNDKWANLPTKSHKMGSFR